MRVEHRTIGPSWRALSWRQVTGNEGTRYPVWEGPFGKPFLQVRLVFCGRRTSWFRWPLRQRDGDQ
jgi:hypothetical protein